ncbi:MAG TPA: disulfide bond formation protein B [Rhodanobacteraceae bacterium]
MNPFRWSYRTAYLAGFVVCILLLGYAFFSQYFQGQLPCNLCLLQRVAFGWMALWFLLGGLHAPRRGGRWSYAVLVLIGAAFGVAMAIRQLWLQSLPAGQIPSCNAEFNQLYEMLRMGSLPFGQFVQQMLQGSSSCGQVTWKFLGLSMAGWTLIWYVILAAWAWVPRRRRRFGNLNLELN